MCEFFNFYIILKLFSSCQKFKYNLIAEVTDALGTQFYTRILVALSFYVCEQAIVYYRWIIPKVTRFVKIFVLSTISSR